MLQCFSLSSFHILLFRRRHCVIPLLQEQPMDFPSWRENAAWLWLLCHFSHLTRLPLGLTSSLSYQPIYVFSLKRAIYSSLIYPSLNFLHLGLHPTLVLLMFLPIKAKCTGHFPGFILLDTMGCPFSMKHCISRTLRCHYFFLLSQRALYLLWCLWD